MSEQELQALIVILQRAPVTAGEALWLNALLDRLREQAAQKEGTPS